MKSVKPLSNTGRTSPSSSPRQTTTPSAWDKPLQLPKRDTAPKKPETYQITETRLRAQQREFTVGGNRQRSLSISDREEKRTVTVSKDTNKAIGGSDWTHTRDINRQHQHPGGDWHTPTATPAFTGGSTSTPTERGKLDDAATTRVKTHFTGPYRY